MKMFWRVLKHPDNPLAFAVIAVFGVPFLILLDMAIIK